MIAQILIHVLFGMALSATGLYAAALYADNERAAWFSMIARRIFSGVALGLVVSAVILVVLIL